MADNGTEEKKILDSKAVDYIRRNLYFNYHVLAKVIKAMNVKNTLNSILAIKYFHGIGQSVDFVSVLLEMADNLKTNTELIEVLYSEYEIAGVENPKRFTGLSGDDIVEALTDFFGFDAEIWFGARKFDLKLDYDKVKIEELKPVLDVERINNPTPVDLLRELKAYCIKNIDSMVSDVHLDYSKIRIKKIIDEFENSPINKTYYGKYVTALMKKHNSNAAASQAGSTAQLEDAQKIKPWANLMKYLKEEERLYDAKVYKVLDDCLIVKPGKIDPIYFWHHNIPERFIKGKYDSFKKMLIKSDGGYYQYTSMDEDIFFPVKLNEVQAYIYTVKHEKVYNDYEELRCIYKACRLFNYDALKIILTNYFTENLYVDDKDKMFNIIHPLMEDFREKFKDVINQLDGKKGVKRVEYDEHGEPVKLGKSHVLMEKLKPIVDEYNDELKKTLTLVESLRLTKQLEKVRELTNDKEENKQEAEKKLVRKLELELKLRYYRYKINWEWLNLEIFESALRMYYEQLFQCYKVTEPDLVKMLKKNAAKPKNSYIGTVKQKTSRPDEKCEATVKPNAYHLDNIINMLIYNMGYFGAGKDLIKRKAVMMLNRYEKKGRDIRYAVPSPLKIDLDSELIELINNIRTLCGGVSDKKKSVNKVINVRVGGKEYSEIKSDENLGRIYTISLDDVHDETVSLDEFKDFYRNFTWDGKSKLDDGYIEKLYKEYINNIADISPKFSVEDVESLGYKKQ